MRSRLLFNRRARLRGPIEELEADRTDERAGPEGERAPDQPRRPRARQAKQHAEHERRGATSPADLHRPWEAVWWAGSIVGAAAALLLALAVYPKIVNRHPGAAVTYFNEIAQLSSIEVLDKKLTTITEEERLLKQLYAISKIARKKYLFIVWSMRLLVIALILILIASIASRR
jgi:hypothetical protein